MTITIKFFASFREQLNQDTVTLQDADHLKTPNALWQEITDTELPINALIAINHHYAEPNSPIQDGDEVGFFPPVTGG